MAAAGAGAGDVCRCSPAPVVDLPVTLILSTLLSEDKSHYF